MSAASRVSRAGSTLVLQDIRKRYGETVALDGLDLTVRSGELLGIAGPNGAGKSTLMKILAGEEPPDAGSIQLDGKPWGPSDRAHRVAVVHQEPQLFPNLTVGQNLVVGREGYYIGRPRLKGMEREILGELGISDAVDRPLGACPLVTRQLTSIAKALVHEAELFLFDEPNSALTEEESVRLFEHMHELEARGHFIILVSHRLGELVAHAREVAIIREGKCAAILRGKDLTEDGIARQLVVTEGDQEQGEIAPTVETSGGEVILKLEAWTHAAREFDDLSLEVRRGEILAVVGVEGSGARELLASVVGLEPATGTMVVAGHRGGAARDRLTAFLPADRRSSLFPHLSVGDNLVARLGSPQIASVLGYLRRRRISALAREMVPRFHIKARSIADTIRALSGGNQQKVAIAAAIAKDPKVLILEEPTRGVDIGSKAEIYRVLREFVAHGNGILMYCTEVPEVFELADRVAVVEDGKLRGILDVHAYSHVASLASDISVREEHESSEAGIMAPEGANGSGHQVGRPIESS